MAGIDFCLTMRVIGAMLTFRLPMVARLARFVLEHGTAACEIPAAGRDRGGISRFARGVDARSRRFVDPRGRKTAAAEG